MNMSELMEFLKVKRSTIYKLREEGLPVIHLGRVVRFDREEIIRWLKDRQRADPPRPERRVPRGEPNVTAHMAKRAAGPADEDDEEVLL